MRGRRRRRRAHPRIFRLYHTMAPTTSSASSSSRNKGTTMEAAPAVGGGEGGSEGESRTAASAGARSGAKAATYCRRRETSPRWPLRFHTCSPSSLQDTWGDREREAGGRGLDCITVHQSLQETPESRNCVVSISVCINFTLQFSPFSTLFLRTS